VTEQERVSIKFSATYGDMLREISKFNGFNKQEQIKVLIVKEHTALKEQERLGK